MRTIRYFIMVNAKRREDIIYLLKYLQKLLDSDLDKRLVEQDLTGQQGRILFYINKEVNCLGHEVHQNDIEREYHLSKSTVSGIVKRLEKKEIITIEKQHPYAILKPTDKGCAIIEHIHMHKEKTINQLTKDLNEEEKQTIIKLLNKLIENMGGGIEICGRK